MTNLYNLAQPLIRYELADSFVREPGAAGTGHLLARVQGRADEVFHYQAGDLHPHVIRSVMLRSPEVADYQVRQTRTGIEADIIAALRRRQHRGTPPSAGGGASRTAGLSQPDVTVRIVGDLAAVRWQRKAPALHPAVPVGLTVARVAGPGRARMELGGYGHQPPG